MEFVFKIMGGHPLLTRAQKGVKRIHWAMSKIIISVYLHLGLRHIVVIYYKFVFVVHWQHYFFQRFPKAVTRY